MPNVPIWGCGHDCRDQDCEGCKVVGYETAGIGHNGSQSLAASPAVGTPPISAPALLTKAADLMAERGREYDNGNSERSMGKAVRAFNAITGQSLSEPEGWLLLQVLKDVRLFNKPGYHRDSAEDCIAYAALKAESKQAEAATIS